MIHMVLHDGGVFKLESWGNGLSYELLHKPSNMSTFVQGDDADRFAEERELVERHMPDKTDEQVLMWLWDQCDYGSAAQEVTP